MVSSSVLLLEADVRAFERDNMHSSVWPRRYRLIDSPATEIRLQGKRTVHERILSLDLVLEGPSFPAKLSSEPLQFGPPCPTPL